MELGRGNPGIRVSSTEFGLHFGLTEEDSLGWIWMVAVEGMSLWV